MYFRAQSRYYPYTWSPKVSGNCFAISVSACIRASGPGMQGVRVRGSGVRLLALGSGTGRKERSSTAACNDEQNSRALCNVEWDSELYTTGCHNAYLWPTHSCKGRHGPNKHNKQDAFQSAEVC